ncbi:MAG: type transport system ATP-binding protein [Solirubrobacteraceae bacterium]|jgi:ABC-2 type transport system ATP-binding protein|nr:type transport system ATP-binding protein [Solirubrobacteraceae bacterium]
MSLEIDGLTRRFGETVALDGITFTVPAGTLFGFVGRNGAGKTTTMRIVLGVLAADAGEVRWNGAPVKRAAIARFGYMPEERGLYPKMAVREQLLHFARLHGHSGDTIDALLERLGVADRAGDKVEELSLGNQQRVQLAAALVHQPDLLVLDEPFSGLDPIGVDVLAEVLQERVAAGVSVIFSSHQLELVERLCDRIAIVEAGRLVAEGTVGELRGDQELWEVEVDGELSVESGDRDAILADAIKRGSVGRFAKHEPPLAELFREAVR